MTAPKFTPGPWVVDEYEGAQSASGELIMWFGGYGDAGCIVKDADRALIAAAPELYEALAPFAEFERVRNAMGGNTAKDGVLWAVNSSAGSAEITAEDLRRAIAALAKARGES
ncbi:hypothetical protein [Lysobacter antibioticus]|uniref:hypothetical protein n=1 Tax=Lysobacter antibioticus TaxID=84531 RepID=UPI0007E8B7DE|nr:hypothetical protein [Lysobacter antibioticus]